MSLTLFMVLSPVAIWADLVWTPKTGWYNPSKSTVASAKQLLAESNKAFTAKAYDDAMTGLARLLEHYPLAPEVNEALKLQMESQFLSKHYGAALETIDLIVSRNPDDPFVVLALKRKYEIGLAYVSGHKRQFLGVSFSAESYGVELLDGLVREYAYLTYSDDALLHIASYYFRNKKYQKAEVYYGRVLSDYPQSEWAGISEYQSGACALHQLKGVEYDFEPVENAERHFDRYLRLYRGGDKVQESLAGLKEINRLQAARFLGIAKFYQREEKPHAVRYYCLKILREYPKAPASAEARKLYTEAGGPNAN